MPFRYKKGVMGWWRNKKKEEEEQNRSTSSWILIDKEASSKTVVAQMTLMLLYRYLHRLIFQLWWRLAGLCEPASSLHRSRYCDSWWIHTSPCNSWIHIHVCTCIYTCILTYSICTCVIENTPNLKHDHDHVYRPYHNKIMHQVSYIHSSTFTDMYLIPQTNEHMSRHTQVVLIHV